MPSLLDPYPGSPSGLPPELLQIPAELPNFDLSGDPREMERARMMALARFGLGVAGREPLGSAFGAGVTTGTTMEANARAEARANMELALKQHQAKQQYLEDVKRVMFIKSVDRNTLRAAGIPDVLTDAVLLSKNPQEGVAAMRDFFTQKTYSPGQVAYNPLTGVTFQVPREGGQVVNYTPQGEAYGMSTVPGALTANQAAAYATARGQGLGQAATTYDLVPNPNLPGTKIVKRKLDVLQDVTPEASQAPQAPPQLPATQPTALPPNATQTAAQRSLGILQANLTEEQQLLAEAQAARDPIKARQHTNNIAGIQNEMARWQKIAGAPAPAAAPAPAPAPNATRTAAVGNQYVEYPPAAQNYQYNPTAPGARVTQRPIEGGPADTTTLDTDKMRSALEDADRVAGTIGRVKEKLAPWTTGVVGSVLGKLPEFGPGAHDLSQLIESIKSNIGFGKLMEMRAQSPTGASGLGQLAVYELDNLQKSLGSLAQSQSAEQLSTNLDNVMKHYRRAREAIVKRHTIQMQDFPLSEAKGTFPSEGATGGWDANTDPLGLRR